jgi:hypothetical protein
LGHNSRKCVFLRLGFEHGLRVVCRKNLKRVKDLTA